MRQCLKCGKKITGKAVFCDNCESTMRTCPVNPGTVIHILPRPGKKQLKHKNITKEEQLDRSRKVIKWLLSLVALLSVLLIATAVMLLREMEEETPSGPSGREYTVVDMSR